VSKQRVVLDPNTLYGTSAGICWSLPGRLENAVREKDQTDCLRGASRCWADNP